MEPTLTIGQRVLVDRIGMDFSGPHVGEIVVFHPPKGAEHELCGPVPHTVTFGGAPASQPVPEEASVNFIKRIVAGPGRRDLRQGRPRLPQGAGTSQFVREQDSYIRALRGRPGVQLPDARSRFRPVTGS